MFLSQSRAPVNLERDRRRLPPGHFSRYELRDMSLDADAVQSTMADEVRIFKSCVLFLMHRSRVKLWPGYVHISDAVLSPRSIGLSVPIGGLSVRPTLTHGDRAIKYFHQAISGSNRVRRNLSFACPEVGKPEAGPSYLNIPHHEVFALYLKTMARRT